MSPSSRRLGRQMASHVPPLGPDGVVVELGPGTGVVTACLVEHGVPESRLACLEYAPEFAALVRIRFPRAHVVQGDAYDPPAELARWIAGRPLKAVVSSLPLMTRPEPEREAALRRWLALLPPGAPFVQFTYALSPPVRPERVGARAAVGPWVTRNLPPARVVVYRRGDPAG